LNTKAYVERGDTVNPAKAEREARKQRKRKKQKLYGIPGTQNEFGQRDLTPHNAGGVMARKNFSIKY